MHLGQSAQPQQFRQQGRIHPVRLLPRLGDQPHSIRIHHHHLHPELLQQLTNPRRDPAAFHRCDQPAPRPAL